MIAVAHRWHYKLLLPCVLVYHLLTVIINGSFLSYVYRFQSKLRDAKCRLPGVLIGLTEKKD